MARAGHQAVQGDHPEPADHADGRAFVVQAVEEHAGVGVPGVPVARTERGTEAGPPVVVTGGVDVRDPVAGRELPDPIADQGAALGRAVVGDVATDDDQVQVGEVAAIAEDLVEGTERIDTVAVEPGGGGVGVGKVEDPMTAHRPAL